VFWLAVLGSLTLLTTLAPSGFASSLYRRVDEEGVTHFTNAPSDPRFKRVGALFGTEQGWFRLPEAVRSGYSGEIREIAARCGNGSRQMDAKGPDATRGARAAGLVLPMLLGVRQCSRI